jgi:hypothetical protein
LPWSQVTKVSSTYTNQHTGLCVICSGASTFFSLIPSDHNEPTKLAPTVCAQIHACKIWDFTA